MKNLDAETKDKIIRLITAIAPNVKIYLFGSRAQGTNDELSDIDIALAGHELPILIVDELRTVFEATVIPYKIEIVDFHRIPIAMQQAIKQEGILWKA